MNRIKTSIIIPCYNENKFISGCLDSIIQNDYPKDELEVLVIDGMSDDGSRTIIKSYTHRYPFIKLLDNPGRITPIAFNIGIKASQGDIIIIMSSHAAYPSDYVSKCVYYLMKYNADCIGGQMITLPRDNSIIGKAIAGVVSSRFGFGNAYFRTGSEEVQEVDAIFGGCYRRELFNRIGLFNESLARGQDREFYFRMKNAGGKILLVPDIICYYYARSKITDYLKWILNAGLVPFYISRLTGKKLFAWRNLIPLLFVTTLISLYFMTRLNNHYSPILITILTVYFIVSVYYSYLDFKKENNYALLITMIFLFPITHILYGIGSYIGILKPLKAE